MSDAPAATVADRLAAIAPGTPGLLLLMLIGSRARGDAHAASDWDFGYLAEPEIDIDGLRVALAGALGTDRIDLVDLERAGALLRYRAARDGRTIYERHTDTDRGFRLAAADFWCDAGPLLRNAYADVLAELDR